MFPPEAVSLASKVKTFCEQTARERPDLKLRNGTISHLVDYSARPTEDESDYIVTCQLSPLRFYEHLVMAPQPWMPPELVAEIDDFKKRRVIRPSDLRSYSLPRAVGVALNYVTSDGYLAYVVKGVDQPIHPGKCNPSLGGYTIIPRDVEGAQVNLFTTAIKEGDEERKLRLDTGSVYFLALALNLQDYSANFCGEALLNESFDSLLQRKGISDEGKYKPIKLELGEISRFVSDEIRRDNVDFMLVFTMILSLLRRHDFREVRQAFM